MTRGHNATTVLATAAGLPITPLQLIAVGAVLAAVGLAMVSASGRKQRHEPRRRPTTAAPRAGRPGALTCTAVASGLITGGQWAVLSQTDPAAGWALVWLVVLGLPAFLAGATVARLLTILGRAYRRPGPARSVSRGWVDADG